MKWYLSAWIMLALVLQGCSNNAITLDTAKAVKFDPSKDANPKTGGPPEQGTPAPLEGKRKGGGTSLPPAK